MGDVYCDRCGEVVVEVVEDQTLLSGKYCSEECFNETLNKTLTDDQEMGFENFDLSTEV